MRFLIVGNGKMGQAIERIAVSRGHTCGGRFGREQMLVGTALADVNVELAFEFSAPDSAERNVDALLRAELPVICGTTGWTVPAAIDQLASEHGALMLESNFSIGMALFQRIVQQASREIGSNSLYQSWIAESHHRQKKDRPSGTAIQLAELMVENSSLLEGWDRELGPETTDRVEVSSVRAGNIPGEHTVGFDGEYDTITLRHAARSRDGFALGAVLAGEWLVGKRGRHSLDAVLGV